MKDPRIAHAYDSIEPSEEALDRMLESVLEARAALEADSASFGVEPQVKDDARSVFNRIAEAAGAEPEASAGREAAKASRGMAAGNPSNAPAMRRRKGWRFVAAAAACLVLVAGVGLFALGGLGMGASAPESADRAPSETGLSNGSIGYDYIADTDAFLIGEAEMPIDGERIDLDPFNTEGYDAIEEHGFSSVANQPFSTFSADVDTASYTNWRRMVNQGAVLGEFPGGSIRVEEFLNYFEYAYPFEDCDCISPFRVSATISDCPWNPDTKLLVLGLKTRELSYADLAKGNNLVFLIDVSGSMNDPEKLGLLQDSFAYLVDELKPDDTVSIVTYSGEERVVLEGVPASSKRTILDAIYSLEAHGSTNGEAGLAMAYELAERHFIEGGNNRIVLASDGDLNVGMTSDGALSDYVSKQRENGVYLTVLGFGDGNYQDAKMETIADDGNGNYYYIDCMAEAKRVFGDELSSTMVTVADDVKLQLEFNPAYVKGYRQVGYENRELSADEFRDDKVDAGEVGAGHTVTVAYELVMADSAMELFMTDSRYGTEQLGVENGEWFVVNVRWKEPGETEAFEDAHAFGEESYTQSPSADWTFAAAVIEYCMIATESRHVGEATVMSVLEKVDDVLHESGDPYRSEFRSLVANSTE